MASLPNRPLSPHLQVYRLPLTALLSISHRITGVLLSLGLLAIPAGLAVAAWWPERLDALLALLRTGPVQVAWWAWLYALMFHVCHGIRHLLWDLGFGLERQGLLTHNILEIAASLALTGGLFLFARLHSLPGG